MTSGKQSLSGVWWQANQIDRKSLLSIEEDSVAIDDEEFDTWVESKLDMALGQ